MIDLTPYPRCKSYLAKIGIKEPYTGMNEYWAALSIAESFPERKLRRHGGIDFHNMPGSKLLAEMERFLAIRPPKKKNKARNFDRYKQKQRQKGIINGCDNDKKCLS